MASRVSQILWGPSLENVLAFGYPLRTLVTDREPRQDFATVQAAAGGAEDGWATGFDYTMECEATFVPLTPNAYGSQAPYPSQSPIVGALGVQDFLDYARAKNTFRFVPDVTLPQVYIDGCYLADPIRGGRTITSSLEYAQQLKLRNPSVDFLQAFRGLFMEFTPGGSLSDPVLYSYSRATVGYEITREGYLLNHPANSICDGHYVAGLQTTLLSRAIANDVTNPEAIGSWPTLNNGTVSSNQAKAPDGNLTGDLFAENTTATVNHSAISNAVAITSGDTVTGLIFVRSGGRYKGRFRILGATHGIGVQYDLSVGTIVAGNSGSGVLTASNFIRLANGWFGIWIRGTCSTETSVNLRVDLQDAAGTDNYTGDGVSGAYWWGATMVHGANTGGSPAIVGVSDYTPSSSNEDIISTAWNPAPQAMWAYVKFVELGSGLTGSTDGPRIWAIGSPTPQCWIAGTSGKYSLQHHNGVAQVGTAIGPLSAVAPLDVVELLALLNLDGSVRLYQCRNAGAIEDSGASSPAALASAWGAQLLRFNNQSSGFAGVMGLNAFKCGPLGVVNTMALARAA